MSEKMAYTPKEFAELFGHEKTWTYRLHKAGKILAIEDYGKLMIPASEAIRLQSDVGGQPVPKPANKATKTAASWSEFVKNRKGPKKHGKRSLSQVLRKKRA